MAAFNDARKERRKEVLELIRRKENRWSNKIYRAVMGLKFWLWAAILGMASVFIFVLLSPGKTVSEAPVNDSALIININSTTKSFSASPSARFQGWSISDVKKNFGKSFLSGNIEKMKTCVVPNVNVPEEYNVMTAYPKCFKDYQVRDSGDCNSDYALAVVSTLSDRWCIYTGEQVTLSAQEILSCAPYSQGCAGGAVDLSIIHAQSLTITDESCFAYSGHTAKHTDCSLKCKNGRVYPFSSPCRLTAEEDIKREIFGNGPVVAVIPLSNDLLVFSDGVYEPLKTTTVLVDTSRSISLMMVAVKILGWGKERGKPYWLAEFNWGPNFGAGGYVKLSMAMFASNSSSTVLAISPGNYQTGRRNVEPFIIS